MAANPYSDGNHRSKKPLAAQELRLLQLAANGETYRKIAEILGTTPHNVKHISCRAANKLGADNRTHAVAQALRKGLIK